MRRAGPNYQEGLKRMRDLGLDLGVPLHVFGPETHMTAICGMALGTRPIPKEVSVADATEANFLLSESTKAQVQLKPSPKEDGAKVAAEATCAGGKLPLFHKGTKSIVWGMQTRAVQGMLDFDFVCRRTEPSVVAIVYPFTGDHKQKFYWGHSEVLIPVFKHMKDAFTKFPEVDVMVNFASLRSAYESTLECMSYKQIRCIAIIAEGNLLYDS